MRYMVVYDIADDRLRNRISDLCQEFGVRVQESVFECELEENGLALLVQRLAREIADASAANVRLYRVCRDCLRASLALGQTLPGIGDEPCIVV